MCARETDPLFDKSSQHHLSMADILRVFDADKIAELDKMFMCGNYGDPAAGRHTMNIYQEFRKINPGIVLGMNTNGAIQDAGWWKELGQLFNQLRDYVVFSIDGLEDTNHIYRKNVVWKKLMTNVIAYVSGGGTAHWDMLVYKHNQHQVDQAEQLARDLGFRWFRAKISKRGFTELLQAPIDWQDPRSHSTSIQCRVIEEQSLYIDAQGRVSPCCWLGGRQTDFVTDFDAIAQSWTSTTPNAVCVQTCGSTATGSNFSRQWQREVQL